MNEVLSNKRVLALDLRPRSYGYAVFEGPERLPDWGVRSFRNGVNEVRVPAAQKLAAMLDDLAPSVVVTNHRVLRYGLHGGERPDIWQAVQREAKKRKIPIRFLSTQTIQRVFRNQRRTATKHEIACNLANRYCELQWLLPPQRRCWQSEDYRMSIFDAAAIGLAYFTKSNSRRD